jgi:hypothetical protein
MTVQQKQVNLGFSLNAPAAIPMFSDLRGEWRFLAPDILAVQNHKINVLMFHEPVLDFIRHSTHAAGPKKSIRGLDQQHIRAIARQLQLLLSNFSLVPKRIIARHHRSHKAARQSVFCAPGVEQSCFIITVAKGHLQNAFPEP